MPLLMYAWPSIGSCLVTRTELDISNIKENLKLGCDGVFSP
jgi:hypothetical protein